MASFWLPSTSFRQVQACPFCGKSCIWGQLCYVRLTVSPQAWKVWGVFSLLTKLPQIRKELKANPELEAIPTAIHSLWLFTLSTMWMDVRSCQLALWPITTLKRLLTEKRTPKWEEYSEHAYLKANVTTIPRVTRVKPTALWEAAFFVFLGSVQRGSLVTGLESCLLQKLGCGFCAKEQLCFWMSLCMHRVNAEVWWGRCVLNTIPYPAWTLPSFFPWAWIKDNSYGTPTVMWPAHTQGRIHSFLVSSDKTCYGYSLDLSPRGLPASSLVHRVATWDIVEWIFKRWDPLGGN